ncbi:MAG: homocitrate synthase/isopropylmalate synthase family protein [Candidatus Hadarchaeaceae archaeon]
MKSVCLVRSVLNFEKMEQARREYMEKMKGITLTDFDLDKWEKIRERLYPPRRLNLDVIIDDTTLRDGLQMAGLVSPLPADASRIAELLRDIGVERLEVLTYTKSDKETIRIIQDKGMGDMIAAWCRASKDDVDSALQLDFRQIGISHPVSYIHFEKWSDVHLQDLVKRVADTVVYAKDHGLDVFVHGEDSTRADWEFESCFINAVAEAGATAYRICDTIGCGSADPNDPLPIGIPMKVKKIKEETKIPYIEIHAHDDLGTSLENTMAAIRAASGIYDKIYVSSTFLGIGERSGNVETEKVIMNCYLHHGMKKWDLRYLRELTVFMSSSLKYNVPQNKSIVGDLAFAHESGVHIHGLMASPMTYELFPPELVGQKRTIVIGKRSGKHGIRLKLEQLTGQKISEDDPRLAKLVDMIKDKFVSGLRRYPIKDTEFRNLAQKVGFEMK